MASFLYWAQTRKTLRIYAFRARRQGGTVKDDARHHDFDRRQPSGLPI